MWFINTHEIYIIIYLFIYLLIIILFLTIKRLNYLILYINSIFNILHTLYH